MSASVSEVLNEAADLLEKPGAWTQGTFARTKSGLHVIGTEPRAVCWCAIGAMQSVSGRSPTMLTINARRAVEAVVGRDLAGWNDAPGRTQAEVVAALREAAKQAGEQS